MDELSETDRGVDHTTETLPLMTEPGHTLALDPQQASARAASARPTEFGPPYEPTLELELGSRPAAVELGRYLLLEQLGAGAMGVVFAAYDPELDRRVAIKLIPLGGSQRSRARFVREARAIARLSHPNVVAIHDVGGERGGQVLPLSANLARAFLVMELVDGVNLGLWLAAAPRSTQDILRVFVAAGRGLMAAHAMGIVHRDFKPNNVLIGAHGQVKVADFGLATEVGRAPEVLDADFESSRDDDRCEPELFDAQELLGDLTRTGAMMGTPAYMAPEQFLGGDVDTRSDQFNFCAALYEALFGHRAFAGDDVASLRDNVIAGRLLEPPARDELPARASAALLRGLAADPSQRHPSMAALLAELEPPRERGRTRAWIVSGALALGLVAVLIGSWAQAPAPVCTNDALQTELWTPEQATQLRRGFAQTGRPHAETTAARAIEALDRYARDWSAQRQRGCQNHVKGSWSQELYDRQVMCLTRRRQAFEGLVEALAAPSVETLARALPAIESLPELERCEDPSFLAAAVEPPSTPALAREVEGLREQLERAAASVISQPPSRALARVEAISASVDATNYTPLLIERDYVMGDLLASAGRFPEAEATLVQAYFAARRWAHDELASKAALELIIVVGIRLDRVDEGLRWSDHAEAELARSNDTRGRVTLLSARGRVLESAGRYDEALLAQREARTLLERGDQPDSATLINVWGNLGALEQALGHDDEALRHFRHALELGERSFGVEHPQLIDPLIGLAQVLYSRGELEQAEAALTRVKTIRERSRDPDSLPIAQVHNELGMVYVKQGRMSAAIEAFERALVIEERLLVVDHPDLLATLNNLAAVSYYAGDYAAAERRHRRVLELRRARDPQHPEVAMSEQNLGFVIAGQGRHEQALEHYQAAQAIYTAAFGPDSPHRARVALNTARSLHALGRDDEALTLLDEVERLRGLAGDDPHPELIEARVERGVILRARAQFEAAEVVVREAVEFGERLDPSTPQASYGLLAAAELELARGRPEHAEGWASQAIARLEASEGKPGLHARALFLLAQAKLTRPGERAQALALAERARQDFAALADAGARELVEVEAWLDEVRRAD